jgi:hypothetical protein
LAIEQNSASEHRLSVASRKVIRTSLAGSTALSWFHASRELSLQEPNVVVVSPKPKGIEATL